MAKPVNLHLYGKPLPWVAHATHLGQEFHEDVTMAMDCMMKRGRFIGRSLEVQDAFSFASPTEKLGTVKLLAAYLYGGTFVFTVTIFFYHDLLSTACNIFWFQVMPRRQHSGTEKTST